MLLPYASDRQPQQLPVATIALMVVTVGFAIVVFVAGRYPFLGPVLLLLDRVGIVPAHLNPITLFTYMFFHENLGHMLVNLFYLWVFGSGVEDAVGSWRFVLWYFAAGVFGGALQWLVTITLLPPTFANTPIVGASAACAGIVGLFAVRYYRARLSFIILPFRPHVVYIVALYLSVQIGCGIWELATGAQGAGVAYWAHVGGFIFGLTSAYMFGLEDKGRVAYLTADANRAIQKNQPGIAIRRWELLLSREPGNAMARAELARAWLMLGDREQAEEQYEQAIDAYLQRNQRSEAALLYAEMVDKKLRMHRQNTSRLFLLGNALEELEQFELAADTLRSATVRAPDAPATETAMLKVISLYVHRLNRREEARILLRLFMERYPLSQFKSLADELNRVAWQEIPPNKPA